MRRRQVRTFWAPDAKAPLKKSKSGAGMGFSGAEGVGQKHFMYQYII
jgi:hypothetical protein